MKNINVGLVFSMIVLLGVQSSIAAISPVWHANYDDARTDDNQYSSGGNQYWSIDAGADSYQNESYERPTTQTFTTTSGGHGASQYFANLDITSAQAGYDSQYMYIEINMVGNYFHKDDNSKDIEGLKYQYGFRFSDDANGADGYMMWAEFSDPYSQAGWTALKTFGYQDTDGDVGGTGGINITKDGGDTVINGYDDPIISDGEFGGQEVLFVRMIGDSTVQLALDYVELGLDTEYVEGIQYLDMQSIKGDPTDPQNYFWNDKYTYAEAGDPYSGNDPQNIYELDTIRGGAIPEPATLGLLGVSTFGLLFRRRRSNRFGTVSRHSPFKLATVGEVEPPAGYVNTIKPLVSSKEHAKSQWLNF